MKKILFIDDLRNPFLDIEGRVPKEEGIIHWVLNYEQFVQWIEKFGLPDVISFDHDLAFEHYTPEEYWDDYDRSKAYQEAQNYTEKTGKDCANWLVEYCLDREIPLPTYYVHSANPVGADNIRIYLDNYMKQYNKIESSKDYKPVSVAVYECEANWGCKLDDCMISIDANTAKEFIEEFNSKNDEASVPDWYMYAEDDITNIKLTPTQLDYLKKVKGIWLSILSKM